MNRTKAQKQEMVTTLATQVAKSQTIYVTDFTGLNVARITDLRRRLRAVGVEYVVVKNTLARRALTEQQLKDGGLESFLAGPTALVLAGTDPVGAAKVLTDFAREFEKPAIKVGLVEGKPIAGAVGRSPTGAHGGIPGSAERTAVFRGGCPRGAQN